MGPLLVTQCCYAPGEHGSQGWPKTEGFLVTQCSCTPDEHGGPAGSQGVPQGHCSPVDIHTAASTHGLNGCCRHSVPAKHGPALHQQCWPVGPSGAARSCCSRGWGGPGVACTAGGVPSCGSACDTLIKPVRSRIEVAVGDRLCIQDVSATQQEPPRTAKALNA